MNIISFIKGKIKKIEVRNRKKDETLEFERENFGNISSIEGFKILYSNNYSENYIPNNVKNYLSFITIKITLSKSIKSLEDTINFINSYAINKIDKIDIFNYKDKIKFIVKGNEINIYLKGSLRFYTGIIEKIPNNIITKFIKVNMFPNLIPIETPNELLDKSLNSVIHPYKDLDILFIEDKLDKDFNNPVIGLSMDKNCKYIYVKDGIYYPFDDRCILLINISELSEDEKYYIINNVKYGDKLLQLLHNTNIEDDIDEIIS